MTVKRPHDEPTYPCATKRSCTHNSPAVWPFNCSDLNLDHDLYLGEPSLPEDRFLEQVGVCRGVHAAADDNVSMQYGLVNKMVNYRSWQGLSEQSWRCCAELNVLLSACQHNFGDLSLDSSHYWTRAAKAVMFAKVQQHYDHLQRQAQMQLQMVAHIMDSILCKQPEVAICKYSFNLQHACPGWLSSWCLQWGFTSGVLHVLCIKAYSTTPPQLAGFDLLGYPLYTSDSKQTADRTVYVPCIC